MGDVGRSSQLGGKPMGISTQEYWSTVIAVFIIGNLTGWALFGKPSGIRSVLQWGSVADLLAAIGTWVIGAGAWKYARDSHRYQVNERRDAKLTLLDNFIEKASRFSRFIAVFDGWEAKNDGDGMVLLLVAKSITDTADDIRFTGEERAMLGTTYVPVLHTFDRHLRSYREAINHLLPSLERDKGVISEDSKKWFNQCKERAVFVRDTAYILLVAASKAREQVLNETH